MGDPDFTLHWVIRQYPLHPHYSIQLLAQILLNEKNLLTGLEYLYNLDYTPFSTLVLTGNDQTMNSVLVLLPGQGWVQVSSRTIFLLPSMMGSMSVQNSSSTTLLKSSADPSVTTQEMFLVLVPSPHWAS